MLLVIPAIDLVGGHCVRLQSGTYADEQDYFVDPVKMAKLWRVQNARTLHLVDADRARTDRGPKVDNRDVIYEIAHTLDIPIEVAGGLRTLEDVTEMLDGGVYRVVLGTMAVREPDLLEEAVRRHSCSRVVAAIDARGDQVFADGGRTPTGRSVTEVALDLQRRGVRRIIYKDLARDGALTGPNLAACRHLGETLNHCRITASGGVSGYHDLLRLQELTPLGVDSVIVGRALYENRFPCQRFWCWHRKDLVDLDRYSTAQFASSLGEER